MSSRLLLVVVIAASAAGARADTAVNPTSFGVAQLGVDRLRLGEAIEVVEARPLFKASLCDDDPIDHGTRHVWFHAPCEGKQPLPGDTIVAIFTGPAKEGHPGKEPVDAIAWMFGDWPHTAGDFPAAIGGTGDELAKTLGPGQRLFDFAELLDGGDHLEVFRHGSRVYSITRDGRAIGFVVGAMGNDRNKEEWSGLIGNVLKVKKQTRTAAAAPAPPPAPRKTWPLVAHGDLARDAAKYKDQACDRKDENLTGRGDPAHCGPFPCNYGHCVVEKCTKDCYPGFCADGYCIRAEEGGARSCGPVGGSRAPEVLQAASRCRCSPQSATAPRDQVRCGSFPCAPDGCYVKACGGDSDCAFGVCSGHASGPHGYCVTDDPY